MVKKNGEAPPPKPGMELEYPHFGNSKTFMKTRNASLFDLPPKGLELPPFQLKKLKKP